MQSKLRNKQVPLLEKRHQLTACSPANCFFTDTMASLYSCVLHFIALLPYAGE
jgi:hypothetical protein